MPEALLSVADLVVNRYSALLGSINEQRQQAFDTGLDRFDSVVPMPAETPQLIPPIMDVLRAADD